MSCTNGQLMSPGSDDAVSVAQVLGTRGDVAFDEHGSVALSAGQVEVQVTFLYEKQTAAYVFDYLYVASVDASSPNTGINIPNPGTAPDDIRAVVNSQTTTGFRVELSGAPIGTNDTLFWRIIVPDPLQICQPATSGPKYAIVRPSQQGVTPLVPDQNFIEVTFDAAQPDEDWGFEYLEIETTEPDNPQIFAWSVSTHTTAGFRLELSGAPEMIIFVPGGPTPLYQLRWKVA